MQKLGHTYRLHLFFFNDPPTTEIYTLSLHDALPILLGGDYDMTIIGHSEPRDINVYGNPDYYYHYDNPRVRELLDEAEAATSAEEEIAAYQEIATIIANDAVNVWLFSPPYLVAARQNVYGFWQDQPTPAIDVTGVYKTN